MKKRIKKKITRKQMNLISLSIGIVIGVFSVTVLMINVNDFGWEYLFMGLISLLTIEMMIGMMNNLICTRLFSKDEEKSKIQTFLSKEEYREFYFIIPNHTDTNKMILEILRKGKYQFFAKFAKNDDIILIVKDKNGDEIYNCEISNYHYFNAHFKKKI